MPRLWWEPVNGTGWPDCLAIRLSRAQIPESGRQTAGSHGDEWQKRPACSILSP